MNNNFTPKTENSIKQVDDKKINKIERASNQIIRIEKISNIRVKNNDCWMKILKIAWMAAPVETAMIFKEIQENDKKINDITKEMCDDELS